MPDLGHELTFGVFLPNPASQAATVVRLAQLAEQRGLDLIGIQDHPYNPDLLDTWTLLAHLAAATDSIRLFPDVTCLPLRPPAVALGLMRWPWMPGVTPRTSCGSTTSTAGFCRTGADSWTGRRRCGPNSSPNSC